MKSTIIYRIQLLLLLFFCRNISADIVGAYILKHPITNQRVTLLGDIHIGISKEQGDFICFALKELLLKDSNIAVFYEGYKEIHKYSHQEPIRALRRLNYLARNNELLEFIDIENREFLIPLVIINTFLAIEYSSEKDNHLFKDEVLKLYESSPFLDFCSLVNKEVLFLIQKIKEHDSKIKAIEGEIVEQLSKMVELLARFKQFYHCYLRIKLDSLKTNPWLLSLYFKFFKDCNLLQKMILSTSVLFDFNCLFKILEHKKNCIVLSGYGHTEYSARLLIDLGFEQIMKVGLESIEGKPYSSYQEFTNDISQHKIFHNSAENDAYNTLFTKQLCPINLETLDMIFLYNQL